MKQGFLLLVFLFPISTYAAAGEPPKLELPIPQEVRDKTLRIMNRDEYSLDGDFVEVEIPDQSRNRIELITKDGAVVSDNFARIDKSLFAIVTERNFSLYGAVGSMYSEQKDYEDLHLHNGMLAAAFGLIWLKGRYGVMMEAQNAGNYKSPFTGFLPGTLQAEYRQASYRLAVLTQYVPLSDIDHYILKRVHLLLGLGVQYGEHSFSLKEYDYKIKDTDQTWAPFLLGELKWALVMNTSVFLRETFSIYKLEFDKFHYSRTVHQYETLFGVSHAL